MIQFGARNMDNRPLLERAAGTGYPHLLKRGITATTEELLTGDPERDPDGLLRLAEGGATLVHLGEVQGVVLSTTRVIPPGDLPRLWRAAVDAGLPVSAEIGDLRQIVMAAGADAILMVAGKCRTSASSGSWGERITPRS
jgi:hypothetical protein